MPTKEAIFYAIGDQGLVGDAPSPWRIARFQHGGYEVFIHEEDFPPYATRERLEELLRMAMPTRQYDQIRHMRLHLESTIAIYANVKCIYTSKSHGTFYDEPFVWTLDMTTEDTAKWHTLRTTSSLEDTIAASVILLQRMQDNGFWGKPTTLNLLIPDRILALRHVARDLDDRAMQDKLGDNDLFAVRRRYDFWVFRTSLGQFVTLKHNGDEYDDLMYTAYTTNPIQRMSRLLHLADIPNDDPELGRRIDLAYADAVFLRQLQARGEPTEGWGGNVTIAQ